MTSGSGRKTDRRRPILLLLTALLLVASCASEPGGPEDDGDDAPHRFRGEAMGTSYMVLLGRRTGDGELDPGELGEVIEAELALVNEKMSNYLADSELSRLNRWTSGEPFALSPETYEVLAEAEAVSRLTEGAFDITVSPLVRLWGFGPDASVAPVPPGPDLLAATLARVGYDGLELGAEAGTVIKRKAEVELDLSGIAKGYAVDRVAAQLENRGFQDFMVEVGGEVKTSGTNPSGESWRIAIESPLRGARAIHRVLSLSGLALATSGDYRNFHEHEGKLYSHLIDPRNGRPVAHRLASVSVLHESCMRADALASGLLVLGPEDGLALAEEQGLAVLFLLRSEDGVIEEVASTAFERAFP